MRQNIRWALEMHFIIKWEYERKLGWHKVEKFIASGAVKNKIMPGR